MSADDPPTADGERLIRAACRALCDAYARSLDFRDQDGFGDLFTDDAELALATAHSDLLPGEEGVFGDGSLKGRAAIREALGERPDALVTRHVITNVFIEVTASHRARGIAYLTLHRRRPGSPHPATVVGHYEDGYRLTERGWRFSRRTLQLAFPSR